jgi:hypothetical protein
VRGLVDVDVVTVLAASRGSTLDTHRSILIVLADC